MPRRSAAEAADTRDAIVDRAVAVASLEGLEGVTIGRLAADVGMSKAGVVGRFGNKEALQLAALDAAARRFRRDVWDRAAGEPPGRRRLLALCEAWIDHLEGDTFPGGCFVTAVSCEFDGRPSPVRDRVRSIQSLWLATLAAEVRAARRAGELPRSTDPDLVAFQLNALAMGANQGIQLELDPEAPAQARRAMRALLRRD